MRPSYRVLAGILLVALAVSVVGYVALHKSDTAVEKAKSVQREVKTKAPRAALAKTDKKATTAKKATDKVARTVKGQVVKLDRTITVLGRAGVNGLPGKNGRPGPPGPAAVVPFTLAEIVAGVSERLTGRLPSAAAVAEACGDACVGPRGVDGRDATDAQVDQSVARRLPDALTTSCGGPCNGPPGQNGADSQVPGPQGPPPQPFTYTFTDGTGVAHSCTIDPNVGPGVVQACS